MACSLIYFLNKKNLYKLIKLQATNKNFRTFENPKTDFF